MPVKTMSMYSHTTDIMTAKGTQTYQRVSLFPPQLLPQELNDGLELVRRSDLEEILFHDRCRADRLEAYHHCQGEAGRGQCVARQGGVCINGEKMYLWYLGVSCMAPMPALPRTHGSDLRARNV